MNLSWVKPLVLRGQRFVVRNAPHILMGIGTTASISGLIFMAKAAPEAKYEKIDAQHRKAQDILDGKIEGVLEEPTPYGLNGRIGDKRFTMPKLTPIETVKVLWRPYAPAIGMEALALACFWCAHGIDIRRQAVLAGLCSAAEEALQTYQKKVQTLIGEKAEKEVRNAIAQDKVDALPPPQNTVILSEDADLWCIIDGQYFRSSWLKIKEAQNDANHEMIQHMYISQADLYWLLDPEKKYLKASSESEQIGWNVDEMLYLDIDTALGPDHKPILSISYYTKDGASYPPQPGYSRML